MAKKKVKAKEKFWWVTMDDDVNGHDGCVDIHHRNYKPRQHINGTYYNGVITLSTRDFETLGPTISLEAGQCVKTNQPKLVL